MNLTSDRERILALRRESSFSVISYDAKSYWEDEEIDSGCLFELDVRTPVDFIEVCSQYVDMDRARVLAASAFKCRSAYGEKKKNGEEDTFIPEFVYNF